MKNQKGEFASGASPFIFSGDEVLEFFFALSQRVDQLYNRAEWVRRVAFLGPWDAKAFRLSCELYAIFDRILHEEIDMTGPPGEVIYVEVY